MRWAAATHVGRVRQLNEDSYLALPGLAVVADGMGGHACGDVASALAVSTFRALGDRGRLDLADVVRTVGEANSAILDDADRHPEKGGMGTTVSGVAMVDQAGSPHWLVFNVGDSRVYRISGATAVQLTVDHSEVAELMASGRLTRESARSHPMRHVITRALGTEPPPVADTWLMPACPGDLFLVCSDGLTSELDDQTIARLIRGADTLDGAASTLVDAAVRAGGRDNVTVVLVAADAVGPVEEAVATQTIPRARTTGGDLP